MAQDKIGPVIVPVGGMYVRHYACKSCGVIHEVRRKDAEECKVGLFQPLLVWRCPACNNQNSTYVESWPKPAHD